MNRPKSLAHPLTRLRVRAGEIVHGTSPDNEHAYMAADEIRIAAKLDAKVAPDGVRTAFRFKLNAAPDAPWLELFDHNIADLPPGILRSELKVEIKDAVLTLLCLPSHLERIYAFVKACVAATNTDYAAEKRALTAQLEMQGQTAEIEAMAEKNKIAAAKQKFETLEL